jgi:uncharacterized spore protein YtfJ
MSLAGESGEGQRVRSFAFIHVDELGVKVAPIQDPLEEERLEGLARFLVRVLEALERAGAKGVRIEVDWNGGSVVLRRGRDGIYGIYAKG